MPWQNRGYPASQTGSFPSRSASSTNGVSARLDLYKLQARVLLARFGIILCRRPGSLDAAGASMESGSAESTLQIPDWSPCHPMTLLWAYETCACNPDDAADGALPIQHEPRGSGILGSRLLRTGYNQQQLMFTTSLDGVLLTRQNPSNKKPHFFHVWHGGRIRH